MMKEKLLRKIKTILNHFSLWFQLAVLMIILTTVIAVLLIRHNYTSVRNQVIQNQITLSSKLLKMESQSLNQYLMALANFCVQPYYDLEFTRLLNQKSDLTSEQTAYIRQQMYYYYYTRSDLLEYEVYLINQDISIGRTMNQQHMTLQPEPTFDVSEATRKCAESSMHHYIEPADSPAFFTYYHSLFQVKGKKQQSIVRLKVDTSALKQFLANHSENNEIFVFLNDAGELIFTNHENIIDSSGHITDILATQKHHKQNYDTVRIDDETYLLVTAKSSDSGLSLLCFTPLSYIDSQFGSIGKNILASGIAIWLCTIILMYLLLRMLTAPLKTLSMQMQKTGHGDFHTSLHADGNREVSELSISFNSMVTQIDQLIQRTYIAELSEKNAKLTALEAQINPHFLYNTLQAISTEALLNDQPQIHKMTTSLASNLRYTIKDGDLVTLKREMEYVSNYIFLQKMRMDDALSYTIDIDPAAKDYLVPKISIHTLVENSIIHGLSRETGKIAVHVSAAFQDNTIVVRVRDDGCGIPPAQLKKLKEELESQKRTDAKDSIGLTNLYIRLQLLYQEPARMEILSEENLFTEITLTLPAIKEVPYVQSPDHRR